MTTIDYDKVFGSDSGEDEDLQILNDYFVDLPLFNKFYDSSKPLQIVRGRKGIGKSTLLKKLEFRLKAVTDSSNIVITTTGNQLLGLSEFKGNDQAYYENYWKQVICKRICSEIGTKISFALSDNSISMVESAEIDGFKDLNIVSSLTQRMGTVLKGFIGLDVETGAKNVRNPIESLRRFQEEKEWTVWLLIDDIDVKYIDDEISQQKIGAFFSAIRSLAFSVKGLNIRTSVRTDVWKNLRKMEDQDKLRQYVIDIKWGDNDLKHIFAKKMLSYLQRTNYPEARFWLEDANYYDIVNCFFEQQIVWDGRKSDVFVPIKTLAGGRPRWIGQLCKAAGEKANDKKIGLTAINLAMYGFSQERVSDIEKEHRHQFQDLQKVIHVFRAGKREYNMYQLNGLISTQYIDKLGTSKPPAVNGESFSDVSQISNLLFQVDFLSGCRKSNPKRYVKFENEPELFLSPENSLNDINWTINSSYRNHLGIP